MTNMRQILLSNPTVAKALAGELNLLLTERFGMD